MVRQRSAKSLYAGSIPTQASRSYLCESFARVAELVYAHDLKSCLARDVGSMPTPGTKLIFLGFSVTLMSAFCMHP